MADALELRRMSAVEPDILTPEDWKVVSELTRQIVCRASGKPCRFASEIINLTLDEQVVAATDCRRAEAEYCNVNGRSVAAINGGGL